MLFQSSFQQIGEFFNVTIFVMAEMKIKFEHWTRRWNWGSSTSLAMNES